MKIAFAGTPEFAKIQLAALIQAGFDIAVVYTQPDKPAGRGQQLQQSPVKILALTHHIPVEQPVSLKSEDATITLMNYGVEMMIVAAYGLLLPEAFLKAPRFGCINVHASLLPRWRGASPIQQAILMGDKETGVTLMQMDVGLDTGDMLAKATCAILDEDTTQTLHDKLAIIGAKLLCENLASLPQIKPEKQNGHQATHAGKITKAQAKIDWGKSAVEIHRLIRAFNPWPIAFSIMDEYTLRIIESKIVSHNHHAKPGTILEHTQEGCLVATNQNALLITLAQLPGKKAMPSTQILTGHYELFAVGKCFS